MMWASFVYILFPFPFFALVLLSAPLPAFCRNPVRRFIHASLDNVLNIKIGGKISVIQLALFFSTMLTLFTAYESSVALKREKSADTQSMTMTYRCSRWRVERNFWISLFSTTLWLILIKFKELSKELQQYREAEAKDKNE